MLVPILRNRKIPAAGTIDGTTWCLTLPALCRKNGLARGCSNVNCVQYNTGRNSKRVKRRSTQRKWLFRNPHCFTGWYHELAACKRQCSPIGHACPFGGTKPNQYGQHRFKFRRRQRANQRTARPGASLSRIQ